MAADGPLLEAEGASFGYAAAVLRDVTLAVRRGERVGVVGPNGAGKSTLLRGLLGILPALAGRVRLGGRDVTDLQRYEVARRVAYLPQEIRPAAGLTALDVVLLGRAAHRAAGPAGWAFDTAEDVAAAHVALGEVGVEALGERPFRALSGGERRLVLLAQALAQAGDAVVLDEPTAALDLRAQVAVADRLRAVADTRGLAVVLVTHDLGLAARVCDRLVLLLGGRLAADGPPDTVLEPGLLAAAFGVDLAVLRPEGVAGPVIVPRRTAGS